MRLNEDERVELNYAILKTEEFYQERLQEMLEIRTEENVEESIRYWEKALQNIRGLRIKIEEMRKKGEL